MSEGWGLPRYIRSRTMDSSSRAAEVANTEMRQGTPLSPSEGRGLGDGIPSSPPPSYEHVLEETRLAAAQAESARTPDDDNSTGNSKRQEATATTTTVAKRPEILHKSSKELYRAVAAQWGITCKMSDHCRCLDCQSKYFDCEYDQNEQEKTDGGLGAGTPMFIEVMHGTACSIL